MAVATGTAILMALGAKAATSAIGAKVSSNAASKSAQTLEDASKTAGAAEERGYADAMRRIDQADRQVQTAWSPYVRAAGQASSQLLRSVGLPGLETGGAGGAAGATSTGVPNPMQRGARPQPTPPAGTGATANPMMRPGPMVTMESPDGTERKAVPQSQQRYWEQRGARMVA